MFRAERHPGDTGGAASTKARGSRTGMRWRVATLQRRRSVRRQSAYPLRTLQHLFTVRCIGEAASQVATGVQPEMPAGHPQEQAADVVDVALIADQDRLSWRAAVVFRELVQCEDAGGRGSARVAITGRR